MPRCHRILVLLFLVAFVGCGQSAPQQTLVFLATPLPGAAGAIDMDTTIKMVKTRIAETKIRKRTKVESAGAANLEVSVFGATPEELEKIKSYVSATIDLEFAAVAHSRRNDDLVELAKATERDVVIDGRVHASWVPLSILPDGSPKTGFVDVIDSGVVSRDRKENGKTIKEWLVVYEPDARVTGDLMESAFASVNERGFPCIIFTMNPEGAANLSYLTNLLRSDYRRLAIVINGEIYEAPVVQSPISKNGHITGSFSQEEVERTAMLLQAGRLPCVLTFRELKAP